MDKKTKALKVIEGLSLCTGLDLDNKAVNSIYRYAHVALGNCENKHPDWSEELDETYKDLKAKGII